MILLTGTAAYTQNSQEVPRRTAEEQAALEKATPCNPAKPAGGELNDPKMAPGQIPQTVPVNWKPEFDRADAERLPDADGPAGPANPGIKSTERTQPEGTSPGGATMNYRTVNGTKTQPEPTVTGSPATRRGLQGARTQPEGQTPQR